MNDKSYKWILYFIVTVIVATIGLQLYWNSKNYEINKQQLINDVQASLDNAVDAYYTNLAQNRAVSFSFNTDSIDSDFHLFNNVDSIRHNIQFIERTDFYRDSININDNQHEYRDSQVNAMLMKIKNDSISVQQYREGDSILYLSSNDSAPIHRQYDVSSVSFSENDTLTLQNLNNLTSKVIISMHRNRINLNTIDSLFKRELEHKNVSVDYGLEMVSGENISYVNHSLISKNGLSTTSKSPLLPFNTELSIYFSNETKVILRRILTGILMSTLLVLSVISCLFYLLKIIRDQKQLAEVKNDLISNITHEFKTPIATIGVALESIKNFKVINDKAKTETYLDMSTDQLSKLNVMVEKLLETATLDSDSLDLNLEDLDLNNLLADIVAKHQIQSDKTITFNPATASVLAKVDPFHFDNAINNVIDNANKYGGDVINITISANSSKIKIDISDNGNTLNKVQGAKVFEKFYRVQKGNTHDVKGFGIGLYYTKRIIEKHNGTISLHLNSDSTTFKIEIPNG